MLKPKPVLITLVWSIITLVGVPLMSAAAELGTQGINFEGQSIDTTTTFTGGFVTEDGLLRGDGSVQAGRPVKVVGQINVDSNHQGQLADLVVYVYYATLEDPKKVIPLVLAADGSVSLWNSDVTSLTPFVKSVQLQPNHSLDLYNQPLLEGTVQVYFGYLLEDGTLITNRLPIEIAIETLPTVVNIEATGQPESVVRIDVTPLLTAEDDGRLVGQYALRWPNGTSLKVGFDFSGADTNYTPAVCSPDLERSVCENTVADAIISTASAWSQTGNIYFRRTAWEEAEIRLRFAEDGSHSYVGIEAQQISSSEETMNLAFSFLVSAEDFRSTVLHEFGHAIGLKHEHNSPNVTYHWQEAQIIVDMEQRGWNAQIVRKNIIESLLNGNSRSAFFATPFDPQSIMIYPIPKNWVSAEDLANAQQCPDAATTPDYCVAPNSDLSDLDQQGIADFYPQRSLGNGCSYIYDPSAYRPDTALWDGHIGYLAFNNPTSSPVKLILYHPDTPQWAFASWDIPANINGWILYENQNLTVGMDWGIQVNDSPICILKVVSDWNTDYFQTSTTRFP